MSSNEDDENENDHENGKKMMKQWVKTKKYIRTKNINDYLDEIIDKSKSFEEQIKLI